MWDKSTPECCYLRFCVTSNIAFTPELAALPSAVPGLDSASSVLRAWTCFINVFFFFALVWGSVGRYLNIWRPRSKSRSECAPKLQPVIGGRVRRLLSRALLPVLNQNSWWAQRKTPEQTGLTHTFLWSSHAVLIYSLVAIVFETHTCCGSQNVVQVLRGTWSSCSRVGGYQCGSVSG